MRGSTSRVVAIAAVCFGVAWLLGCGRVSRTESVRMDVVGPYRVGVSNQPDPPRTGENIMRIVVQDAGGKPVDDAQIDVVVFMPAMGAMPYMESRGTLRRVKPGEYHARYGLSMAGEWDVKLSLRAAGRPPARADYRLSTSVSGIAPAASMAMPGDSTDAGEIEGVVTLDAARRQSLGVRTEELTARPLSVSLRATGRIAYSEAGLTEVSLKCSGWVRAINVDYVGRAVRRGETLFWAYSPEVWAAQREYIEALKQSESDTLDWSGSKSLAQAARQRLLLWDVPPAEIIRLARTREPMEAMPLLSPVTGVVVEKNVVAGSPFQIGQVLYRLARTDSVWVLASLPEMHASLVRAGMRAHIRNPYVDKTARIGRVSFVYPTLDSATRAGQIRIDVANPRGDLKPGTFVEVDLDVALGSRLAVPESAVLPTGERRLVFVDLGEGRLAPREVQLGHRAGDRYEVLSGLKEGDRVVVSGGFMVAAESKLRSAVGKW